MPTQKATSPQLRTPADTAIIMPDVGTPLEPDFRVLSFQPHQGDGMVRRYQKRRKHHKSKVGCFTCKVKRVKCDELRPYCSRCQRSNAWCSYSSNHDQAFLESSSRITLRPPNYAHRTNTLDCGMRLASSLCISPAVTGLDLSQDLTSYGMPRIALIHHFQNALPQIHLLGSTSASSILALGIARPFLLDALLAVSASHLRHHYYHTSEKIRQETRVAEHFQQALAVRGFRNALTYLTLDQQTADAFVLTCMLLNLLTFTFNDDEDDPENSWIFRPGDPQRLNWFSLQLGLKPLLVATEKFRTDSILAWLYKAPNDDENRGICSSLNRLPAHWMAFLGLDAQNYPSTDGIDNNNILCEPARMLAEILDVEPCAESFFLYVSFVGALDMEFVFRDMLEAEDERAVWLFGYWLGLMCRFGWWWIHMRVNREWRAICLWLNRRGVKDRSGEDGRIWRLLMQELEEATSWPRPRDENVS
ncbi:hypothetical protein VTI74DRAFT_4648 [Chaetomium olivicolor]